jgi:polyhydroxyalkanoate synthesis regulator phasin
MDEPVRRLVLALVGAVSLTAERADELADSLAARGGMSKEGAFRELGLVTRDEWDELELRVAQIEHRLRLVEGRPRAVPPPSI